MASSHSKVTAATATTVQAPPVYSTLSPPSYNSASSDTNSVLSGTSTSKKFFGKMWNSGHEEKSEKQRKVEEKEVRATARAVYFSLQ
ncbi:hypothetical protein COCMIDRAFT_5069 [Bipolaris oryzae ATCC 44560]|uniref:Uncharacterized protein n=1 Tax=Bipolaris oryzae ATCC 44560 TaxID=930090 RepID=W6Z1W6_COCMI|nr:uncharacterized protein COCMIDRAFT_5069 [Bipolaris oryzae ATCC 44560]EUC45737.1 hypothetical protein COCMIDRAFT_5069 [Bipolaris oryzae ATCC 44560]